MLESGAIEPGGLLVRAAGRNLFRRGVPISTSEEFVATGDPDTAWHFNLAPGGLSNQWTGAVPRFSPDDFVEGGRLDERYIWPISYADLQPYYSSVERLLDITASRQDAPALPGGCARYVRTLPKEWQRIARTAAGVGQGLTLLPLADGPAWLFTRRGTAFNSYTNVVRPLERSPHFELRTGAHALHLEWSGAHRRVEAVVYHDRGSGRQRRVSAAAVVIACGALRSTKLLFDSACPDFPDGIGNSHGVLGRYFHDHLREWWSFESPRPLPRLSPAGYLTRRPYETSAPLMATSWTLGLASYGDRLLSLLPTKTHRVGVQVFGSMRPTEGRYVRPHPERLDEFGLAQLELSIAFDHAEVDNVVAARHHLLEILDSAGYPCRLDPVAPQLVPGSAVHYGGTARMHRSPEHGVLDAWNRPFDVPNVVVADASCFTTNTEKNPTLTAMALSARAADRLGYNLKHGFAGP
jgi:choline dehydrogenase-like flavoprotein